ncbi:hypothetical protein, partial [Klebsiella pneumoniae]
YQIDTILFNIRKSLIRIAIHLNILCNSIKAFSNIDINQFDTLSMSNWWDSRVFFDISSKNAIFNFPKDYIAQEFKKYFDSEILRR